MSSRELYHEQNMRVMLLRMAYEIVERHADLSQVCMLGIQPRGILLGKRLQQLLEQELQVGSVQYGDLDVTFYRDDFRRRDVQLTPNATEIDFIIEGKQVILIDDVLYTGRTVRAAMDAMLAFGRPAHVELAVLVERNRMRELPVSADYVGITIDTLEQDHVEVHWKERQGKDHIHLLQK